MDFVTSQIAVGGVSDVWRSAGSYEALLTVSAETPIVLSEKPHLRLELEDGEQIPWEALDSAARFLDEQLALGRRVLVHCVGGMSRSVSVVCAYLALRTGEDIRSVLARMKSVRPQALPDEATFDSASHWVDARRE